MKKRLRNDIIVSQDMPRVSVVYDRKKRARNGQKGTVEVMVYMPKSRKRKYISTGVRVWQEQWSDVYGVVGCGKAAQYNREIHEQVAQCVKRLGESPTLSQDMKVDRSDASFLDWLYDKITRSRLGDATLKHHWVMYRNLEAWGKMRRWQDVTTENIWKWIADVESRGVAQTTIHGYWKRLRKWLRVAIVERRLAMDCYLGVHVERGKSKMREFLTDEELDILINARPKLLHLEQVRRRFLVQCGCGLAYSDLMSFDFTRHVNLNGFETILGSRLKTKEQFFIVLLPWAVEILEDWKWSLPKISLDKYNEYIGELCDEVGIHKHVTSHIARHTYACYCLRHNVNIVAVQRTLGHADIRTTEIYAHLAGMDVVNAFKDMKK